MNLFDELVGAFGDRLGISGLAPGRDDRVTLQIESVGQFQLERDGDSLLATLARAKSPYAASAARTLLKLSHWRENHPWPIHPGMKGDDIITMTARIPMARADVPTLESTLELLSMLLGSVEAAG